MVNRFFRRLTCSQAGCLALAIFVLIPLALFVVFPGKVDLTRVFTGAAALVLYFFVVLLLSWLVDPSR